MKVISYSLFGYGKPRAKNCDNFNGYLRGLMINVRLQRLIFPDWRIRLYLDADTYKGFERFFDLLSGDKWYNAIDIEVCEDAHLTKAMLWRLKPMFDPTVERFICRDLDSPLMYKDAQAVKQWIDSGKTAHAITASGSHTVPMLGGMIGFTKYANDFIKAKDWDSMVNQMSGYETKGADQDFLGKYIYRKFAGANHSIMSHYFFGMPDPFLDGYKTCSCPQLGTHAEDCPLDIQLEIPRELKETDNICGHIGAAGYYEIPMNNFLAPYFDKFDDLRQIEEPHNPSIFNWNI